MLRVIAVSLCGIMLWLCGTNPELWLMLALPALIILSWAYINDAVPQYRCAAYSLTQTDDLRTLPMLLLATRHAWGKHPEVLYAISRLLVQVTEAEVGLLNDKRQERLWRLAVPSLHSDQPFNEALTLRASTGVRPHRQPQLPATNANPRRGSLHLPPSSAYHREGAGTCAPDGSALAATGSARNAPTGREYSCVPNRNPSPRCPCDNQ